MFDFGTSEPAKTADSKQQSLIDIATAPQGEFDFDFAGSSS